MITNILISDVIGDGNLFEISQSKSFILNYGNIQRVLTYSIFIFEYINSNVSFSHLNFSHFYPQLIYASYSFLTISNCSFTSSYEKFGDFEVSAILLEYNMSFTISDSQFNSLKNNLEGAVIFIFML